MNICDALYILYDCITRCTVHNPGTAFYPSTSGHTIPAVVSYESNPRALLAPYPSPQRAWIPTPPRGQIGQAAHGFVHAMPGHLQTGLRPVPATFGPHPHQSQMHPPLQYVAYNDILSPTSTPVSNLNEPMGNREGECIQLFVFLCNFVV